MNVELPTERTCNASACPVLDIVVSILFIQIQVG